MTGNARLTNFPVFTLFLLSTCTPSNPEPVLKEPGESCTQATDCRLGYCPFSFCTVDCDLDAPNNCADSPGAAGPVCTEYPNHTVVCCAEAGCGAASELPTCTPLPSATGPVCATERATPQTAIFNANGACSANNVFACADGACCPIHTVCELAVRRVTATSSDYVCVPETSTWCNEAITNSPQGTYCPVQFSECTPEGCCPGGRDCVACAPGSGDVELTATPGPAYTFGAAEAALQDLYLDGYRFAFGSSFTAWNYLTGTDHSPVTPTTIYSDFWAWTGTELLMVKSGERFNPSTRTVGSMTPVDLPNGAYDVVHLTHGIFVRNALSAPGAPARAQLYSLTTNTWRDVAMPLASLTATGADWQGLRPFVSGAQWIQLLVTSAGTRRVRYTSDATGPGVWDEVAMMPGDPVRGQLGAAYALQLGTTRRALVWSSVGMGGDLYAYDMVADTLTKFPHDERVRPEFELVAASDTYAVGRDNLKLWLVDGATGIFRDLTLTGRAFPEFHLFLEADRLVSCGGTPAAPTCVSFDLPAPPLPYCED